MKKTRVTATAVVAFCIVLGFFLLPLPLSRVRSTGLIEVDADAVRKIYMPTAKGAVLVDVLVEDGQRVKKGDKLLVFRSEELETLRDGARNQKKQHLREFEIYSNQATQQAADPNERSRLEAQASLAWTMAQQFQHQEDALDEQIEQLTIRAPIAGTVISPPKKEDIGKGVDEQEQMRPVCQVGNTANLKVLVPIAPHEYQLLKEEMAAKGDAGMEASIRVPGHGWQKWEGRVTKLPTADAKTVPLQLTFKGGGPLAEKPGSNPNAHEPQNQVYLIEVELLNPNGDATIRPGVQPTVKIHCGWRSGAWWTWRAINVALDLGLM
jgi:biotin carboxyl carrier protein